MTLCVHEFSFSSKILRPSSFPKSRQKFEEFFLCYSQSPLHSTALPWHFYFFKLMQPLRYFLKLTQPLVYFSKLIQPATYFYSSVTVHCKGERRKAERKAYPLPYGLWNPYRNLKSENSQDYAQKPQRNCTFMTSASGLWYSQASSAADRRSDDAPSKLALTWALSF